MMSEQIKVIVFCFLASLVVIPSMAEEKTDEKPEEQPDEIIEIKPATKVYSMAIREFHECVSCNSNDQARKDYDSCLKELSSKNQELIKSCCKPIFGDDFCDKAASGKTDYPKICQDPKKALEVGKCFWKKTESKESDDIQKYRQCKRNILDNFCTTSSSS